MRMVSRVGLVLAAAALLAGCAGTQRNRLLVPFVPNPTAILTSDIAQNREAQEDGVLKALRSTAADEAIVFTPQPADAGQWLRQQDDFPQTRWSAHKVLMSCDGMLGVTTGAIRWGDVDGTYTTIWRYYPKGRGGVDGKWRWVASYGNAVETPLAAPEIITTETASCDNQPSSLATSENSRSSGDATMVYSWDYSETGGMSLAVKLWDGADYVTVLQDIIPAR